MIDELSRLKTLLSKALAETAELWPPVKRAFDWVYRAARILSNHAGESGEQVRRRLQGLLGNITRHRWQAGPLAEGLKHFLKVSKSYWPGLFHCYDLEGLDRTNNRLEQYFGSQRYHERRSTGRKRATSQLVRRGAVRLVASALTRLQRPEPDSLAPRSIAEWRALRKELEERQEQHRQGRRFRKQPEAYLAELEQALLKPALPA